LEGEIRGEAHPAHPHLPSRALGDTIAPDRDSAKVIANGCLPALMRSHISLLSCIRSVVSFSLAFKKSSNRSAILLFQALLSLSKLLFSVLIVISEKIPLFIYYGPTSSVLARKGFPKKSFSPY
jgi:hypothetical protein